jgi:hypothetical protein
MSIPITPPNSQSTGVLEPSSATSQKQLDLNQSHHITNPLLDQEELLSVIITNIVLSGLLYLYGLVDALDFNSVYGEAAKYQFYTITGLTIAFFEIRYISAKFPAYLVLI